MLLTVFLAVLAVMMLAGFPIYLALAGASLSYVALHPDLSMLIAVQKMLNAPNSFTLLAVPFFIFAGQVMNYGGVTDRIFGFANALIGHYKGGLGYVNVFASVLFAGMSGSAIADAGGLGLIEIKAMRDAGYDDDFTIGVTAASSIIGPIIPPSIPFVVYGAVAGVSIGGLFIGGVVPGLLMAAALCAMVYLTAKKRDCRTLPKLSPAQRWRAFKRAFLSILTPVIIIGGIWGGFFTPTEAAFVSVVYALGVTILVYREQRVASLPALALGTLRAVGPAIIIVASANVFGWIMNYEKVDVYLMNVLFSYTTNKYVILLLINLVLLIMGMFLEVVSAIMIMLPLATPIIDQLGIHPIHFGVVMVLNLMIGLLTPPVGFVLYILASVANVPVNQVIRTCIPWSLPLVAVLLLITYVPELVMFLPRLLGFVS
ncbi:MAG: TRAP transporter large permease [Planctomycetota bacterium]|jgi:tripartite ATP-independent transporter DctM subunit|nr:TRAP transporter large permease [Planctomycetota bacterium]